MLINGYEKTTGWKHSSSLQITERLQNVLASATIAVLILELIYCSPIKSMVASLLGKFKPEINFVM